MSTFLRPWQEIHPVFIGTPGLFMYTSRVRHAVRLTEVPGRRTRGVLPSPTSGRCSLFGIFLIFVFRAIRRPVTASHTHEGRRATIHRHRRVA